MKIKLNQQLVGINGKSIPTENNSFLTLKDICTTSILAPIEGDGEKEKFGKWEIYKKIRDSKSETDLTIDDLATIKRCIAKFQPPLILGQCFELIEKSTEK
jgi:hypothetical protein